MHAQNVATQFLRPVSLAYDSAGDLFVADSARNQVIELTAGGVVTVVAGNGTQGFSGDGGPATSAELNSPTSVAIASDGTLYIADTGNQRIRVLHTGTITTFAGNGARGFGGDGGAATAAELNRPLALALDSSGALLICDQGNQRVRRISSGQITTIAGDGTQGFAGDGGVATQAELSEPSGLAASSDGRIFIADTANQRVRVVSATGIISTYAGTGVAGAAGDGGPATAAQLSRPIGLVLDAASELLIADENNHRLRKVAGDGTIATIAGNGRQGTAVDGSIALASAQDGPGAVAMSAFGWPIIGDSANGTLRILFSDGKLYAPGGLSSRTTTASVSAPSAVYGTAESTVSVSGSPSAPQGLVQITDNGTKIATASLTQGTATIPLSTLNAGLHNLTVAYAGDGLHPSASTTASIAVSQAPVTASATPTSISYGAPVPALTGAIAGILPQDQASVIAAFTANTSMTTPVGVYPIAATLTGSASGNYSLLMAANSGALTIVPAATIATLTPPSNAYETLPLQLSARVASTTSGTPTGTVQFLDGSTVIATAQLNNGVASAIELNPVSGGHTLSVIYSGDANFHASTSADLVETVNALPDFTIGVSGSTKQTVISGSSATYNLAVASQASPFTGAVTLSATGLPAGATVSFSPTAVVPGASTAAVTMTITTRATAAYRDSALPVVAFAAAGFCLVGLRRRCVPRLFALLIVAGLFGLTGCGARTVSESALSVQSFAIQVQATGTNLAGNVVVHTTNVTLSVE